MAYAYGGSTKRPPPSKDKLVRITLGEKSALNNKPARIASQFPNHSGMWNCALLVPNIATEVLLHDNEFEVLHQGESVILTQE